MELDAVDREIVVKRVTVTKFGVNDGGDNNRGCFGIELGERETNVTTNND